MNSKNIWFLLKAQQGPTSSKQNKKKHERTDAVVENLEDYIDPKTPFGDKKILSRQMAKQFSPSAVEKSYAFEWFLFLFTFMYGFIAYFWSYFFVDGMNGGNSQASLRQIPAVLNLHSQSWGLTYNSL